MGIRVNEVRGFDRMAWDRRVASVPEGTIHQSTHVEDFHTVTGGGCRVRYLVAEDEGGAVAGQLAMFHGPYAAPEFAARPLFRPLLPLFHWAFGTYTWIQGPLVFARERLTEVYSALLQHIAGLASREAFMIRSATMPPYEDPALRVQLGSAMAAAGFSALPAATFLVDLERTPEQLWQGLKSSARKNLRKLLDGDQLVASHIDGPEEVRAYWEMLAETQRRNRRFVSYPTIEEFRDRFWDKPHRSGVLGGLLVRTREGDPVSGLLFRGYNRWLHELGVAYTAASIERKIYGQDFIKWKLMLWGQEQGFRKYDLMGAEPASPDPKKRAIFQFKEKWGGELVDAAVFSRSFSPWRTSAIRLGARLVGRRIS